jgi:cholesterol transport system auxiliary component
MIMPPDQSHRTGRPTNIATAEQPRKAGHVATVMMGLLSLIVLAGGCTALQTSPVQTPITHVLVAKPIAKGVGPKRDLVLDVGAVRAWPGFDTLQMAYVRRPYELDYFATAEWADTPARMLGPLLAQALEQAGSFRAVVQTPGSIPADLRINAELIRLQQNFGTRPSHVELALRVQLIDVRAKRILASRLFEEAENAPTDDAYGGVTAANVALQRLLERLTAFCAAESGGQ